MKNKELEESSKIIDIIKKYNIVRRELENIPLKKAQLSNILSGKVIIKTKHHSSFKRNIIKVLKKRGLQDEVDLENIFNKKRLFQTTGQGRLEEMITTAIKDRTIYTKKKRLEIEALGHKLGIYSYKYRFILANIFKNKNQPEKALEQLVLILSNFKKGPFHNAIILNLAQLKKPEHTSLFLTTYFEDIEDTDKKVKELIFTICGKKLNLAKNYEQAASITKKLMKSDNLKIKQRACKTLAYSSKGMEKYEVAIEYYKSSISDVSNFYEHEKLQLFALECYRELKDIEKVNLTLTGIEKIRLLNERKIYGGDYKLGMAYLFLNEKEKAIKSFEKEIYDSINFLDKNFKREFFLKSIIKLVHLYDKDQEKQLKLIEHVSKCSTCLINFEYIIYLLKFYTQLELDDCTKYLILNINLFEGSQGDEIYWN